MVIDFGNDYVYMFPTLLNRSIGWIYLRSAIAEVSNGLKVAMSVLDDITQGEVLILSAYDTGDVIAKIFMNGNDKQLLVTKGRFSAATEIKIVIALRSYQETIKKARDTGKEAELYKEFMGELPERPPIYKFNVHDPDLEKKVAKIEELYNKKHFK